jgi:hypothetical protein
LSCSSWRQSAGRLFAQCWRWWHQQGARMSSQLPPLARLSWVECRPHGQHQYVRMPAYLDRLTVSSSVSSRGCRADYGSATNSIGSHRVDVSGSASTIPITGWPTGFLLSIQGEMTQETANQYDKHLLPSVGQSVILVIVAAGKIEITFCIAAR